MSSEMYKKTWLQKRKELATRKLGGKCKDCGSSERLEFDHIDPGSKLFSIGGGLGNSSKRLSEELEKCQLLCHTCHWDKTRRQRGLDPKQHGTTNMYINGKCRCDKCKAAWTRYFVPKARVYRMKQTVVN